MSGVRSRLIAIAASTALCVPLLLSVPPSAVAEPAPLPDNGVVGSAPPGAVVTPDGWNLTVSAKDEIQLPVAPLTTATSSREYMVAGTFTGDVGGEGRGRLSGGTLEVGYQIGCGIDIKEVRLIGSAGIATSGSSLTRGLLPTGVSFPVTGTFELHIDPGTVTTATVTKKTFAQAPVRVTLKDVHIRIDGCVGQSFLRSYAIFTSSTAEADDTVAYYGVTKAV
ncbi:MspA protein [Mycolicibacterium chubuense NBB4]|uniref:MspA protein n=1 Tax=Mycolicibacterium chubuense (strain NBB4) TaxID=710421 RepID=I4BIC2_MYCCN|nr:MspA family porin [Mycolicibacterium chubuense]AFM17029.1 MspA protein [Mycolicibacterium chubuense NBB4]